jgi:nucleoside phosphorylase
MRKRALAKQRNPHNSPPLAVEPEFSPPLRQGTGSSPPAMVRSWTSSPSTLDYHVGWICAIETEYVVALELLDVEFQAPSDMSHDDENAYSFGRIGNHNVVITCLAKGKIGLTSAASAATDMRRSFSAIRIGLMVGISGGAPSKEHDIRLGDVVVSTPGRQSGGVIHYEFGKSIQNKTFEFTGSLASPPPILRSAVQKLSADHKRNGHRIKSTVNDLVQKNERLQEGHQRPDPLTDVLYKSSFSHPNDNLSCMQSCIQQTDQIVQRVNRDPRKDDPVIHYGLIASADKLMRDAHIRDQLAEKEGVLCFEMEAAGLMDRFPCVVVRGISDYSDTHKNDIWQGYAAATAAAYAKELLEMITLSKVSQEAATAADAME